MSEELTEKWKNGELDVLFDVYVKIPDEGVRVRKIYYLNQYLGTKLSDEIEIFSPVPTYDHFVELTEKLEKLEKQLDIAVKALGDIVKDYEANGPCEEDCVGFYITGIAQKALKEIDEVKND